jgi:phenylacetate-CoA ligase
MTDLYYRLPIGLQNIACSMEGYRIKRKRFGRRFKKLQRLVEERGLLSDDQMIRFRNERLHRFIKYSYNAVPYYRKLFSDYGFRPDDISSLDDLSKLPVLSRNDVQQYSEILKSTLLMNGTWRYARTSGTTGAGLQIANTTEATQELWAICFRYRKWHRLNSDVWCGHFGGKPIVPANQKLPPYWRYNVPGKQVLFSAYHISENSLADYIGEIKKRKLRWLHGYPSVISLISSYILEHSIDLGYQVQWITIGSENMMPNQAEMIRKAFGVQPRQHYAMTELAANISECEYGKLHVDEDFAAVELIPINGGDSYKIVGTNFSNLAMPLIRYDIQDNAQVDVHDKCSCGKPGRIVKSIDGRKEDYLILKDGTIHGRTATIFKYMVNIREAQLYQRKQGEVILRIVRGEKYNDTDETLLLNKIKQRFNDNLDVIIRYVEEVERSKTGKIRFVVSEIESAKIV